MSKLKKNVLKHKLIDLNMTQADLAEKLGVHRQVVANWIREYRNPSGKNLEKIAKILNMKIEDLLENGTNNISSIDDKDIKILNLEKQLLLLENKVLKLEKENEKLKSAKRYK